MSNNDTPTTLGEDVRVVRLTNDDRYREDREDREDREAPENPEEEEDRKAREDPEDPEEEEDPLRNEASPYASSENDSSSPRSSATGGRFLRSSAAADDDGSSSGSARGEATEALVSSVHSVTLAIESLSSIVRGGVDVLAQIAESMRHSREAAAASSEEGSSDA